MNKLRIASAAVVLASALALPAWAANANDATNKDGASNLDQSVPAAGTAAPGTVPSDSKAAQSKARKHPPTAAMDSATPTEKTTTDKAASTKHAPTSQMDRAAPDQKSPPAAGDATSTGAGPSAASPRN